MHMFDAGQKQHFRVCRYIFKVKEQKMLLWKMKSYKTYNKPCFHCIHEYVLFCRVSIIDLIEDLHKWLSSCLDHWLYI